MKGIFVVAGFALLLVACSPTHPCRTHTDEASCTADRSCQWRADKNKCRTLKEGKKKSKKSRPEREPAPSPESSKSEAPAVTSPEPTTEPGSSTPGADFASPSTKTQPQPNYPDAEPQ